VSHTGEWPLQPQIGFVESKEDATRGGFGANDRAVQRFFIARKICSRFSEEVEAEMLTARPKLLVSVIEDTTKGCLVADIWDREWLGLVRRHHGVVASDSMATDLTTRRGFLRPNMLPRLSAKRRSIFIRFQEGACFGSLLTVNSLVSGSRSFVRLGKSQGGQ
jgi:hypothetical protein